MNFELTNEQIMIRNMVRDFAESVIKPRAIEIDKTGVFPLDIFEQMGKLGLLGIPFPEKYGGSNGDTISYALAVEEIGKVCGSTGLSYAADVSLGASLIYAFGTEDQKQKFLKHLAESNADYQAGSTQTKVDIDGDEFVINGEKSFIPNASYAKTIIVTDVTGKDQGDKNIISPIIVPTDPEGVKITSNYDKMVVLVSNT